MGNPYYELIALMRAQGGRGGDGIFSATVEADDSGVTAVKVDDTAIEEDFWLMGDMSFSAEDDGAQVLCVPFDQGFVILCKLTAL